MTAFHSQRCHARQPHAHHPTSCLNVPEHASVRDRCVTELAVILRIWSKSLIYLVEPRGIEPLTSAVRLPRHPDMQQPWIKL
jgi:hypothetical protein